MRRRLPIGAAVVFVTDRFAAEGAGQGCLGEVLGRFLDGYIVEVRGGDGRRTLLSDVSDDDIVLS